MVLFTSTLLRYIVIGSKLGKNQGAEEREKMFRCLKKKKDPYMVMKIVLNLVQCLVRKKI